MKARELVYGAMLTALALIIPLMFRGTLQVYLPPFSATLGSHVPSMLAMFISPMVAVLVGLGSTIGFLITLGPVIAARAFVHVLFGLTGALVFQRTGKFWLALLAALPVHAIGEALVVLPFGFDLYKAGVVIGVGTVLHHVADAFIAVAVWAAVRQSGVRVGKMSHQV